MEYFYSNTLSERLVPIKKVGRCASLFNLLFLLQGGMFHGLPIFNKFLIVFQEALHVFTSRVLLLLVHVRLLVQVVHGFAGRLMILYSFNDLDLLALLQMFINLCLVHLSTKEISTLVMHVLQFCLFLLIATNGLSSHILQLIKFFSLGIQSLLLLFIFYICILHIVLVCCIFYIAHHDTLAWCGCKAAIGFGFHFFKKKNACSALASSLVTDKTVKRCVVDFAQQTFSKMHHNVEFVIAQIVAPLGLLFVTLIIVLFSYVIKSNTPPRITLIMLLILELYVKHATIKTITFESGFVILFTQFLDYMNQITRNETGIANCALVHLVYTTVWNMLFYQDILLGAVVLARSFALLFAFFYLVVLLIETNKRKSHASVNFLEQAITAFRKTVSFEKL